MAVQKLDKITFIILVTAPFIFGTRQLGIKPEIKIVGGEQARVGQFPYQVSLRSASSYGSTGGHFCGGSILDSSYIITAAHCLYRLNPEDLYVVAGEVYLSAAGQQRKIESISYHSLYSEYSFKFDIGILKLFTPLDINNVTVAQVPLQMTTTPPGTLCTVSGWGLTNENSSYIPDALMYVNVPITDWNSCVRNYSKIGITVPEAGMLCAGVPSGGKDACSGDSGGPLLCNGQLTGIVSWGVGCANRFLPGVYTDVVYYNSWIAAHSGTIATINYHGLYVFIAGYIFFYLIKVG